MPKIINRFNPTKPDAEPEKSETVADMFKRRLDWKPIHEKRESER